jgi:hypothetical protein
MVVGLDDLRQGIDQMRERLGNRWREGFINFYLDDRRHCNLAESCALQSLSGEDMRADVEAREAYEKELRAVIEAMAGGLEGKPKARREEAMALLSILVGGVTIAREIHDPAFAAEIATAVRKTALPFNEQNYRFF